MRFLRYGYLFNERTQSLIRMSDALSSPDLQAELNREEEYIYSLKYRPSDAQLAGPVEKFANESLEADLGSNSMRPYLESAPLE